MKVRSPDASHFSGIYFFYFCIVGIVVPYWGVYLQGQGMGPDAIAYLLSAVMFAKIVTPNVWAFFIDRNPQYGLRFMQLGLLLALSCVSILLFTQQPLLIALFMFGFFVFWQACLPQIEALTLRFLGDKKSHYGKLRLWGSIGFIASVMLFGLLLDYFATTIVLIGVILGILFLLFFTQKLFLHQSITLTRKDKQQKTTIFRDPNLWFLLLLCFLMQLSHAPFYTFFSLYLLELGYSELNIGLFWSVGVFSEIFIFLVAARWLKGILLLPLLIICFAIAALRWCLLAQYAQDMYWLVLAQILHSVTYGLYHLIVVQIIDVLFPDAYKVRGQALYMSVTFGLAGAIGSALAGLLWNNGGYASVFMYASYVMLVATAIAALAYQYGFFRWNYRF